MCRQVEFVREKHCLQAKDHEAKRMLQEMFPLF